MRSDFLPSASARSTFGLAQVRDDGAKVIVRYELPLKKPFSTPCVVPGELTKSAGRS